MADVASKKDLQIIGQTTSVTFSSFDLIIPAKVDTGAYRSSLWASNIFIDHANVLHFTMFDKGSPFYDGVEHTRKQYSVCTVRNSTGDEEIRYQIKFPIRIEGRKIVASFNLSDRSRNKYPILIGCKLIRNKFLVDVSKGDKLPDRTKSVSLKKELAENPYEFYVKYHRKDDK